ncbi:glycosyltransferase [Micromonospora sp. NPDC047548]|uniref:glycosyltransferase n=1 Tax=Micromonospora sp. NPDC047548 TaxID=3155624 RepID=UPI00340CDB6D
MSGRVRGIVQATSHARDLRSRRPPALKVGRTRGRTPVVYYLTPDQTSPRGGVRTNYRHVDLLNSMGIEAAVLHTARGFRCTWFDNNTRTVSAAETQLTDDDILVVPEFYSPGLHLLPAATRTVLFNQGAYHTFDYASDLGSRPGAPYTEVANLVCMLTVSDDSAALLAYTFPKIPVHQARPVINRRLFRPRPGSDRRRVGYVPRRRPLERKQLFHVLRARGVLTDWEMMPIEGYSEARTAEIMQGCAIFLSFSEREGFGLPPVEAMASGCYVVGFTGLGGREYFDPEYSVPVADSDLLAFARAVESAMGRYDTEPEYLHKAGLMASDSVLGRYHEQGLRKDLLSVYGPMFGN